MAAAARFIVQWATPTDPEEFDRHYRDVHIPLSRRLPGLRRYTLSREAVALRGDDAPYLVAQLDWDDMQSLRAALESPEGQAAGEDAAKLAEYAAVSSLICELADQL
jgi:uncharacterized protein (TIGR02118 family)